LEKKEKKEEKGTVFSLKGYEWKWGIKEILPTGRERNRRNVCLIGMVNQNSKTGGLDFWDREEEKEN
jgi:hypothetical protein